MLFRGRDGKPITFQSVLSELSQKQLPQRNVTSDLPGATAFQTDMPNGYTVTWHFDREGYCVGTTVIKSSR